MLPPLFLSWIVITIFLSFEVDFQEFLIGMTTQDSSDTDSKTMVRLQQAFFDFANKHRRQQLIDTANDKSISDTERYEQLNKIFSIQFIKREKVLQTVEDLIKEAKKEAKEDMREFMLERER